MTRAELIDYIEEYYDEDDEIDINEIAAEINEQHERLIEELEERQHNSGFYAFQDLMETRRRER